VTQPLHHSYSALKLFDNCPRQYMLQRITKAIKPSSGEASIYGNRIHEQLEARVKDGTPLPAESAGYEALVVAFATLPGELVVEQELVLTANLEPTTWWATDAWLRSKLDVLVLNGPDAVVADWKTGKHRPDFFQMELFALQVFKHYPDVQRVKCSLVWLKDMKMDTQKYARTDAPALWNKFMSKVSRIEQAKEKDQWPPKPSGLCPWCPATPSHCEFK